MQETQAEPNLVNCTPSQPSGWHGTHVQPAVPGETVYYGQGNIIWGPYKWSDLPQEAHDANDFIAGGEWEAVEE